MVKPGPSSDGTRGCLVAAVALLGGVFLVCVGYAAFEIVHRPPEPPFDPQPTSAAIRRVVRVRIACDSAFRATATRWDELVRARLERASKVFESRFGIRWEVADVVPWGAEDADGSIEALLDDLERHVPRGSAEFVLGFSGKIRGPGEDRDYRCVGMARFFGPCAVVCAPRRPRTEDWFRGSIVHELGHALGAWHCPDQRSVMFWSGDRTSTEDFDAQSAAVVELTRDLDFARGVEWLDEPRRRRIDAVYGRGHARNAELPYVGEEVRRAQGLLAAGKTDEARAMMRRAAAEQEACVDADDPSLPDVLRPLAWSLLAEPGRDVDEAERLSKRAQEISRRRGSGEEPPADGEALAAAVAWERGRGREAVDGMRSALEHRRAALGAFDPLTIELRKRLDRWEAGAPTPAAASSNPPAIGREIRVRIACDEEWRAQRDWEETARERLADASDVFEREFGIRWKAVDVVPWTSNDAAATLGDLLEQVERDVPHGDVDLLLAFSGQTRAKGADREYHAAGQARYYGPTAIVRTEDRSTLATWYLGALIHELGHVLGAWHCTRLDSVMSSSGARTTWARFDAQSRVAVEIGRGLDFAKGLDWLDAATRRRIDAAYRVGHDPNVVVPYVSAAMSRAWLRYERDDDVRAVRAAYRLAMIEQEACAGRDDPAMCECLRRLAWADTRAPQNLDEAEKLARRSMEILAAKPFEEDPPLASEATLADVLVARGRASEAAPIYRKAYQARLAARGASDPDTASVKKALDDAEKASAPAIATTRRWIDIPWNMPAPMPVAPDLRFQSPTQGTVHIRGSPPAAGSTTESFQLATARSGELSMTFRAAGSESAGAESVRSVEMRDHVSAAADSSPIRLWVSFAAPLLDEAAGQPKSTCEFGFAVAGGPPVSSGRFPCDVPSGAPLCLNRRIDPGHADFIRLPTGATCLREWLWAGDPGRSAHDTKFDGGAAVVDGVRITPDGAGAKRTWRIELSFVPDPPK